MFRQHASCKLSTRKTNRPTSVQSAARKQPTSNKPLRVSVVAAVNSLQRSPRSSPHARRQVPQSVCAILLLFIPRSRLTGILISLIHRDRSLRKPRHAERFVLRHIRVHYHRRRQHDRDFSGCHCDRISGLGFDHDLGDGQCGSGHETVGQLCGGGDCYCGRCCGTVIVLTMPVIFKENMIPWAF